MHWTYKKNVYFYTITAPHLNKLRRAKLPTYRKWADMRVHTFNRKSRGLNGIAANNEHDLSMRYANPRFTGCVVCGRTDQFHYNVIPAYLKSICLGMNYRTQGATDIFIFVVLMLILVKFYTSKMYFFLFWIIY